MKLLEISKSEFETLQQMPEIYALMYFGSVARGDSDVYSDCDIFAACASMTREELIGIKSKFVNEIDEKINISVYTVDDLLIMAQKGSLFLTRPTLFHYNNNRQDLLANAKELFDVCASGAVKIGINQRYPLSEAALAQSDLQARKTTGSTILLPYVLHHLKLPI